MKVKTTDQEKIFANHISGKGLVPRPYKELSKSTLIKQAEQAKNVQKIALTQKANADDK